MDILDKSIKEIKGVGPEKEKLLNKLNIYTYRDLIEYFPRTYQDRSKAINVCDALDGEMQLFEVMVVKPVLELKAGKKRLYKVFCRDETGALEAVFFNQRYVKNLFRVGKKYKFYGRVKIQGNRVVLNSPVYDNIEISKNTGYITPIYPLTHKLTQNTIRSVVKNCFENIFVKNKDIIDEYIPIEIIQKYKLMEINKAIYQMHFPDSQKSFELAKRRMVFDELFVLEVALFNIKNSNINLNGIEFKKGDVTNFIKKLPFKLTNAQQRVIDEINKDMESSKCMNRLVQGDVGSGKTVVAMASIYKSLQNNYQGVLLAPTAILATQHFENFKNIFKDFNVNIELLISGIPKKKKDKIKEDLKQGKIDILIGTHAILEDNVEFKNLGIVVTDEQHRFGVRQREKINNKGENVDVLVMSATPIPRTLGLILYGDLDVSVIDELPPNRKQIKTYAIKENKEEDAYNFLEEQLKQGRQGYIVCPLVEENEKLDIISVNELYAKLSTGIFKNYCVKVLHGKMKEKEKNQIMEDFKNKKIDVLISTTVIEVGVDVPNSNIMIVKDAQRFGLAQLHQLRGRVGRGEFQSYCILVYDGNSKNIKDRMDIMVKTNDGFEISTFDMEQRGMGDFFGTMQHGIPELKVANLFTDTNILKYAQQEAQHILDIDPFLRKNTNLKTKIDILFNKRINI